MLRQRLQFNKNVYRFARRPLRVFAKDVAGVDILEERLQNSLKYWR
jgi:hypothetical protein